MNGMPSDTDTDIGGPSGRFPLTRHSAIHSLRSDDAGTRERAFAAIVASYWKPAYKYLRLQWNRNNEDAKDLTQTFFAQALEKSYFVKFDASRGNFRSYLRTCLDNFVSNQDQAATRLKRGGGAVTVPLDFENAEGEIQTLPLVSGEGTEEFFYREWVRHLFATALEKLRDEWSAAGKQKQFEMFERYDLDETVTSYSDLAAEFALPVTTVTNQLASTRRRFRRIVLDLIRDVSGSDDEFQREARLLLGSRWQ